MGLEVFLRDYLPDNIYSCVMRFDYEQQPSVRFLSDDIVHRFEGVPKMEVLGNKNDRSFHDLGCRVPGWQAGPFRRSHRLIMTRERGLWQRASAFSLAPSLETPSTKRIDYKSLIYYTLKYPPPVTHSPYFSTGK